MTNDKAERFEAYGGRKMLEIISKDFYDHIYEDPWLKQFFKHVPQEHIEKQQVDFMQAALGGVNCYAGKTPPHGHKHINITKEVYEYREKLLMHSFKACNASQALIDRWLEIDNAFYDRVVKEDISECEARNSVEGILDFPPPK